jgi:hypothetical protein
VVIDHALASFMVLHREYRPVLVSNDIPQDRRCSRLLHEEQGATTGCPPTSAAATAAKRSGSGEAALALGVRVAVHDSRQNDRNPVIWQPGQDYRIADALQRARTQPTRTRQGPERVGPER